MESVSVQATGVQTDCDTEAKETSNSPGSSTQRNIHVVHWNIEASNQPPDWVEQWVEPHSNFELKIIKMKGKSVRDVMRD